MTNGTLTGSSCSMYEHSKFYAFCQFGRRGCFASKYFPFIPIHSIHFDPSAVSLLF